MSVEPSRDNSTQRENRYFSHENVTFFNWPRIEFCRRFQVVNSTTGYICIECKMRRYHFSKPTATKSVFLTQHFQWVKENTTSIPLWLSLWVEFNVSTHEHTGDFRNESFHPVLLLTTHPQKPRNKRQKLNIKQLNTINVAQMNITEHTQKEKQKII